VSPGSSFELLQALAWLRWRLLMNSLTRSGARDMLERLSRTAESVLPIAILVLIVPVGLGLGGLGVWCGWELAAGAPLGAVLLQIARWGLLLVLALAILAPVLFAAGQQASGATRLLLLPFPRRVLYLAHAGGALADPWIFLTMPLLLGIAVGLFARQAPGAALVAGLAGLGMVLVLLGIAALASAGLQLLVRNRRRAELFVLFGTLLVILLALLPAFLTNSHEARERGQHQRVRGDLQVPTWLAAGSRAVPSEIYVSTVGFGARGDGPRALTGVGALFMWALLAHGLTWPLYQRLLQTPATSGATRIGSAARAFDTRVPGAGPLVSAVAVTFIRLVARTPRGRSILLAPLIMLGVFAAVFTLRNQTIPLGPVQIGGGFSLAIFGITIAIMSLGPFLFNQFAIDRAGLTLQFLAPIPPRDLLYGKAIGGAVIACLPVAVSLIAGIATGAHALVPWILLLLGTAAVYLLFAPLAAILAMTFPRAVDLSSIGQASNAHQAAGLIGLASFSALCAPPALLAIVGLRGFESPALAVALVAGWLLVAAGASFWLFRVAARLLEMRRENLAMVAGGR
jgi:hypothetical protein